MQTHQPTQALGKLIANASQAENKNDEVRVMIRELPAPPAQTSKADKEHLRTRSLQRRV